MHIFEKQPKNDFPSWKRQRKAPTRKTYSHYYQVKKSKRKGSWNFGFNLLKNGKLHNWRIRWCCGRRRKNTATAVRQCLLQLADGNSLSTTAGNFRPLFLASRFCFRHCLWNIGQRFSLGSYSLFSPRSLPENFENFQKRYYYGWACNVNYLTTVWVCIKLRNVLEKELHQAALCVPAWNSYINHEEYSAFHADARLSSKAPFGAAASSSFNAQ